MRRLSFIFLLGLIGCASNSEEGDLTQETDENAQDSTNEALSPATDTVENVMEDFIEFTDSIGDELEQIDLEGDSVFDEFTNKFKELEKHLEKN